MSIVQKYPASVLAMMNQFTFTFSGADRAELYLISLALMFSKKLELFCRRRLNKWAGALAF